MTSRKRIAGDFLYEVYHENSKNFEFEVLDDVPDSWTEIEYKTYGSTESVPLSNVDGDIGNLISQRRSADKFDSRPIELEQVSQLLGTSIGITTNQEDPNDQRRAYPSAGARYPVEVYIFANSVNGLDEAVYHVNTLNNKLEKVNKYSSDYSLDFISGEEPNEAPLIVFLSAVFHRSTEKYASRGYRYTMLEAGHIMQNLCLVATELDLACRPYGGFIEDAADQFLELPDRETTLYVGLISSM